MEESNQVLKKKNHSRIDLNIVTEHDSCYYYWDDPHEMQRGILYRPVKGKIHGNLLDHKQTLGYTGHWAVLSERRSNTVNTCARVCTCVRVYVRREGESGARACKRTLHHERASSSSTSFSPSSFPHRNMQRSHAPRPRRGPRAFYLASARARARQACKRLTGDRYLGSIV